MEILAMDQLVTTKASKNINTYSLLLGDAAPPHVLFVSSLIREPYREFTEVIQEWRRLVSIPAH